MIVPTANYPTSRDYRQLWELAHTAAIVCIVDMDHGKPDTCRDIARTVHSPEWSPELVQVGSRGIGHVWAKSLDAFIAGCEQCNLEWLVPPAALAQPEGGPTYREIMALRDELDTLGYGTVDLVAFARATLARWGHPASVEAREGLSDEEILRIAAKELGYEYTSKWFLTGSNCLILETDPCELLNFARAIIHQLGHPATPPAPEVLSAEVKELVAALKEPGDPFPEYRTITSEQADRIAALLQQQQHLLGLACAELDRPMEKQPLNIIFTGPPGPGNDCVFIDVETDDGRSVRVGEWSQRQDGHWALRLPNSVTSPSSSEVAR